MKKLIIILSLFISLSSCDFLDIVPDNTPVLDDAFKDERAAERFMFSCYGRIPDFTNLRTNPSWITTPEYVPAYHWTTQYFDFISIQQGKYSSANPVTNLWQPAYRGIRQCFTFLDNIDNVPNTQTDPEQFEKMKISWRAQCDFLIAYYHYMLLQNYGPIVIVEKTIDIDATGTEYFRPRKTYDECVADIAAMFDKAMEHLPVTVDPADYGRPTKAAAQALKARMYLYAASPLFNGNTRLYSNFKNKEGQHLVSQSFDKEKWKTALDELDKAITMAETNGRTLYMNADATGSDFDKAVTTARYVMTAPWNKELIWGYSGTREVYSSYSYQKHVIPPGMGTTNAFGGLSVGMFGVKLFFTKDGLPIDKDPDYKYADIMKIMSGDNTIYLHRDREPRFYAWVGFDKNKYPCNNLVELKLKAGETHGAKVVNGAADLSQDHAYSGYAAAKGVNPEARMTSTVQTITSYPYPLARLGEAYLSYAEAYVEYYGKLEGKALQYVNDIRTRAGLPTFETSYAKIGMPAGQALVDAIRRERTVELMYEGHMYYDYRRWMTASKEWKGMETGMWGLNSSGTTNETFYKETRLTNMPFVFTSKQYLLPIHQDIINVNQNLVQNPGWGKDILPELN